MSRSEHCSADIDLPLLYVVSVLCIPSVLLLSKLLHPLYSLCFCGVCLVGFWFWFFGGFFKVDLSE